MNLTQKVGRRLSLLIIFFLFVSVCVSVQGEDNTDLGSEMLLFEKIPMVITSAKREQKITESASAISIVTAEDIKQSGATQIMEALNMVPGLHFGYTLHGSISTGGIRGFHREPQNKITMMIDGIIWELEADSRAIFAFFPIGLEDIERIEVLRGPGSSLYGSDSVFGIINIITKKPEDTQGNLLSLTAGEKATQTGTYMYGGSVADKVHYRFSFGSEQRDEWDRAAGIDDPSNRYSRFYNTTDYILSDNAQINFSGSYVNAGQYYSVNPVSGPLKHTDHETYTTALTYTAQDPDMMVRAYWTYKDLWVSGGLGNDKIRSSGIEFQHSWQPGEKDTLLWGANFIHKCNNFNVIAQGTNNHDLHGIFFENTHQFNEQYTLVAGLRHDHHPNAGDNLSHRVALLYHPAPDQHLRFTWASSFRNPSFADNYVNLDYRALGLPWAVGSEDLEAERAQTFELGYRGKVKQKLDIETNVFYTKVIDYLDILSPTDWTYSNLDHMTQLGTELELKYPLTDWLNGVVNYTYLGQWEKEKGQGDLSQTPQHMWNAQLRGKFDNGFTSNLSAHYRGATKWTSYPLSTWTDASGETTVSGGNADGYIIVNWRLGRNFKLWGNEAELALAVFNLLDKRYNDFPKDNVTVSRRASVNFTYKF